jgi:hypothetical protein
VSGKGDTPRPRQISDEEYDERWKAIFRKPKDKRLSEMRDLLNEALREDKGG